MNSTVQVLTYARGLIQEPEAWGRGEYAYDASGEAIEPTDDAAVCFCIVGACRNACSDFGFYTASVNTLVLALKMASGSSARLPNFNDSTSTTHADVLSLFDAAIELASIEESK